MERVELEKVLMRGQKRNNRIFPNEINDSHNIPEMMMATMTPKSPSALPKISITRIFTKSEEF